MEAVESFSAQHISEVVERYRLSELGAERFAREEGIPLGRLRYWLYEKERNSPRGPVCRGGSIPGFQEIHVASVMPGVASWAAEVTLPRGLAVRFSSAATPQWMGAVVEVLQRKR